MSELPENQARVLRTLYEWQYVGRTCGESGGDSLCRLEDVPEYILSAELAGEMSHDTVGGCLDVLTGKGLLAACHAMVEGLWTLPTGCSLRVDMWEDPPSVRRRSHGIRVFTRTPGADWRFIRSWSGLHDVLTKAYGLTAGGIDVAEQIIASKSSLTRKVTLGSIDDEARLRGLVEWYQNRFEAYTCTWNQLRLNGTPDLEEDLTNDLEGKINRWFQVMQPREDEHIFRATNLWELLESLRVHRSDVVRMSTPRGEELTDSTAHRLLDASIGRMSEAWFRCRAATGHFLPSVGSYVAPPGQNIIHSFSLLALPHLPEPGHLRAELRWERAAVLKHLSRQAGEGESVTVKGAHNRANPVSFTIDRDTQTMTFNGKRVPVKPGADFRVLACLLKSEDNAASYKDLMIEAFPDSYYGGIELTEAPESIRVAMTRIRKVFREAGCPWQIKSIKGTGYRLAQPRH